jgi:hypothetical protein
VLSLSELGSTAILSEAILGLHTRHRGHEDFRFHSVIENGVSVKPICDILPLSVFLEN